MKYVVSKVKIREITSNLTVEGYVISKIDEADNFTLDITNFLNGNSCLHIHVNYDISNNTVSGKTTLGRNIGLTSTCEMLAYQVMEDIVFEKLSIA